MGGGDDSVGISSSEETIEFSGKLVLNSKNKGDCDGTQKKSKN